MAVNWYLRDTLKDLQKQVIPKGVTVLLDSEGKNTASILSLNPKLLPMMIIVIDNKLDIQYIFSWNYKSSKKSIDYSIILDKIREFME